MKHSRFAKKALLLALATLLFVCTLAVTGFAGDREYAYNNKYGQIIPTDSKLAAPKKSYSFSGDSAELYFMRISEGKKNACFTIEIYADKKYTEPIRSLSEEFGEAGNKPYKITWRFKDTPSGVYYGKCYSYVERDDGPVIDSDSVREFKITIDRVGKKTVKIDSVKNTKDGVKVSWVTLATGTKYVVYRKAPGETKWTKIKTLGENKSSYTDKSVKSGKKYTYTVKCYDGDYASLYNKTGVSCTYLSTPKLSKVGGSGPVGYAKVQWGKVSGAKGYYVYRKGGSLSDSTWKKIATIKSGSTVSYVDKKAKSTDWYYTYTVKAYNGSSVSDFNKDGVDFTFFKAPVLKSAASHVDGIKITWSDPNSTTDYYAVYRESSDGWTKIGTTTSKSYIDKTVKSGKTYTYMVRACADTNPGAYNDNGISAKFLSAPVLGEVTFDSSEKAKVTWKKVSGAKGYRVYRKISGEKSWTKIADITDGSKVSYTDKVKKESGKTYTYTVKAVNGKVVSSYNSKGIAQMFLSKPVLSAANKITDSAKVGINVSWKKVTGAKTYHVYRRDAVNTSWKRIATNITALNFHDTKVSGNTAYEYCVKAINGDSLSKYNTVKMIALERPVIENALVTENGVELKWNKVPGADTYYIYRRTPDAEWSAIGSYSLNSYTDTSEEAKTTAFLYTVVAESDGFLSDYDAFGAKNYAEVDEFKATFTPEGENNSAFITLDWAYGDDYDFIEIYKSASDEESIMIAMLQNGDEQITQLTDQAILPGNTYTYTVKTYKEGKVAFENSTTATYPHDPLRAVEFELEPVFDDDGARINITFTPVEFAEEYVVYKRFGAQTKWVKIGTVSADKVTAEAYTFTDVDVDAEVKYSYTVKAVASDRDSFYNEDGKATAVYEPIPAVAGIIAQQVTVIEDGTEKTVARISWDAVDNKNIQKYDILRKAAGGEWETIDFIFPDTSVTTYDDHTIEQGVEYVYTVVATAGGLTSTINEIGAEFCWPADPAEPDVPAEPEVPVE